MTIKMKKSENEIYLIKTYIYRNKCIIKQISNFIPCSPSALPDAAIKSSMTICRTLGPC